MKNFDYYQLPPGMKKVYGIDKNGIKYNAMAINISGQILDFKKVLIKKLEKEMVKVPPNKEYNSTGDSCFNLGCLKAIEIIKKRRF
jgi:hypothetical protein